MFNYSRLISIALLATICLLPGLWVETSVPRVSAIPGLEIPFQWSLALSILFAAAVLYILIKGFSNKAVIALFSISIINGTVDILRFQPFIYIPLIFFLILIVGKNSSEQINGLRLMIAGIYFWAAIQKISSSYFETVSPYIYYSFFPNENNLAIGQLLAMMGILIELGIGLLLINRNYPRITILLTIILHLSIVTLLGINHWDYAVIPLNFLLLAIVTYIARDRQFNSPYPPLGFKLKFVLVLFAIILPSLNLIGLTNDFVSFHFFSARTTSAELFVSEEFAKHALPEATWIRNPTTGRISWAHWSTEATGMNLYPTKWYYERAFQKLCERRLPGHHISGRILNLQKKLSWRREEHELKCQETIQEK